jgi:hypothetical protein
MRSGIREFQPRQPLDRQLSAGTLNAILRELESLRITRVVNGTFRKLPGGTEITVAPQRGSSSTPETTHPFQITSAPDPESNPESPSYLATVRPGTINQIIADNHFDGGELREFSVSSDALNYVVLTATTNGKEITSATLSVENAAPAAQTATVFSLPTEVKYTLGIIYNSAVFQIAKTNIVLTGKIVVSESRTVSNPGELPFNSYYIWA